MKRWLILILLFILIPNINAIGIARTDKPDLNFIPNSNYEFTYHIVSAQGLNIEVFLDGDLEKYAKKSKIQGDINDETRSFTIKLNFPSKLKSGMHSMGIGIREKRVYTSKGTGIGALTSIIIPIRVFVPYPGKYIETELIIPNGNNNELIKATIKLKNLGEQNISSIYSDIEIYNFIDKKITTIQTNKISLNTFQESEIHADLDLNGYEYGEYKAKANIYYDEKTKTLEKDFRVGTYLVKIINYTKEFYQDTFNEFKVNIGSEWNGVIENVYAIINIKDKTLKTTGTELKPFQKSQIITYWNPGNTSLGSYPINITLYYADIKSKQSGEIFIIEKVLTLKDKIIPFIIPSLIILLMLLIIFNVFLVLKLNKRKKK